MKKIKTSSLVGMASLILIGFTLSMFAAEGDSELHLPWDEFQKLLKLDQDQITLSWAEFERLIKQTGVHEMPPFQLQNGNVVLSRGEFKSLLDRMKTPPSETPRYFLTKASYEGRVGEGSTRVKSILRLQVLSQEKEMTPVRFPLFPASMAFEEILLDERPALLENDGSQMYVTVTKPGDHLITAVFSVPSSLKKEPYQVSFSIPSTPITQLSLTIPIRNLDVQVQNASQIENVPVEGGTLVKASIPAQNSLYVTWNPLTPTEVKGPAKIYADLYNLISIEEDALRVRTRVDLDVIQNNINVVHFRIPKEYTILDVQGEGVGEWKKEGVENLLTVPFRYAKKGKFYVDITAERLLSEKNSVSGFDGFQVLKAVREKGYVGVELKTSAEAQVADLKNLDRLDTRELPQILLSLTDRPLIYGFRYLRQPFEFNLDIQRHEDVAVISTVVDEANGVTLVLKDGKRVDHLTYRVRNSWKQFLELNIPKEAQVWSAFVEGQRVKPSRKDNGKVLIPLNRSKSMGENLQSFDVEIMYYFGQDNLGVGGRDVLVFPIPDVVVSQMVWSVYLPTDYDYLYFGGTVDKERDAAGIQPFVATLKGKQRILTGLRSYVGDELYQSEAPSASLEVKEQRLSKAKTSAVWSQRGDFDHAQGVSEDLYARQVERELNFFNKLAQQDSGAGSGGTVGGDMGVLPIRINIPMSGKVFRFTKQIVVEEKPVNLTLTYIHKVFIAIVKIIFFVGILFILIRFKTSIQEAVIRGKSYLHEHEDVIQKILSPVGLVATSFVLMISFSFVSRLLTVLSFFLFLGSLGRFAWIKLKEKRKIA